MDKSKKPPVSFNAATASPAHRKQHKASSSLGSLYEVLADLDETQLHYLIQEMNHTGHQNVPVSAAVSAFESQDPTVSLGSVRASMKPPPLQRQLSKSQQGKLRLQTAFQRAPSLRGQRPRQETSRSVSQPVYSSASAAAPAPQIPSRNPVVEEAAATAGAPRSPSSFSPARVDDVRVETRSPPVRQQQREGSPADSGSFQLPVNRQRRAPPAYKRIERPEFNLPPGITVTDLLQLLEIEYQTAHTEEPASPGFASSTSPLPSRNLSPSPLLLGPTSSLPSPQAPGMPGHRPLRRASSRLDMALDADRSASEVGLGMLEPRPRSTASLGATSAPITPAADSFERALKGGEVFTSTPPPIVMEGIFDVLDNQ